ncbi:hypothetical protein GCM10011374_01620 [Kocuria dechangensis]|uniref:DUF4307 domain-containing protein n=1 Tax=Kocuria dechangensis TaxID=1176249 RepID=A0A917GEV5_9MICC|nr:DUF4307 domain-containing protein [Kocuria dechangensis]GGG42913.1 hypothetical protein GCM10011374_01620 [Kocuria dechangensis]
MSTEATPDLLRNRYGAPARTRRIGPRGWLGILLAATLVSAVFIVWVVTAQSSAPTFKDVGFQIVSETQATADFDLTKRPGDVVTCAVRALNEEYAVVGWKEVTVGAVPEELLSDGRTSSHRVALRTTNLATTAVVDSCWVEKVEE